MSENPKQAAGDRKPQLQLISPFAEIAEAAVLALGAKKYGPWNWRQTKINLCTYVAAIRRHLNAIMLGEDIDPESGQSHWAHIRASAGIVLDAKGVGMLNDDRPRDYEDDRPTDTGSEPVWGCTDCNGTGPRSAIAHEKGCKVYRDGGVQVQSVHTTTQTDPGTVVKECLTTDCGETGEATQPFNAFVGVSATIIQGRGGEAIVYGEGSDWIAQLSSATNHCEPWRQRFGTRDAAERAAEARVKIQTQSRKFVDPPIVNLVHITTGQVRTTAVRSEPRTDKIDDADFEEAAGSAGKVSER